MINNLNDSDAMHCDDGGPATRTDHVPEQGLRVVVSRRAVLVCEGQRLDLLDEFRPRGGADGAGPDLAVFADNVHPEEPVNGRGRLGPLVCLASLLVLRLLVVFEPFAPRIAVQRADEIRVPHPSPATLFHSVPSGGVVVEVGEIGHQREIASLEVRRGSGSEVDRTRHFRSSSSKDDKPPAVAQVLHFSLRAVVQLHLQACQLLPQPAFLRDLFYVKLTALLLPDVQAKRHGNDADIDCCVWHCFGQRLHPRDTLHACNNPRPGHQRSQRSRTTSSKVQKLPESPKRRRLLFEQPESEVLGNTSLLLNTGSLPSPTISACRLLFPCIGIH
mmetsp:Transcript_42909/g.86057  ORF Transcript_42909/g.86057 Transcript_42909/m.86057 type:complete len:331 (-) Transcript_42909:266-1258(-)